LSLDNISRLWRLTRSLDGTFGGLETSGRTKAKEWAYAGVFFTDTGAIASHLAMGYGTGEVAFLALLTGLTVPPRSSGGNGRVSVSPPWASRAAGPERGDRIPSAPTSPLDF
jgi:hypothetical protein